MKQQSYQIIADCKNEKKCKQNKNNDKKYQTLSVRSLDVKLIKNQSSITSLTFSPIKKLNFDHPNENSQLKNDYRLELRCFEQQCQQEILDAASYKGYSITSTLNSKSKLPRGHNHRKIQKIATYTYVEEEIPKLFEKSLIEQLETLAGIKKNPAFLTFQQTDPSKDKWKNSPFSPFFTNKIQKIALIQNQIKRQQNRLKLQLERYEEDKKIEYDRTKIHFQSQTSNLKPFKTNIKLENHQKQQNQKIFINLNDKVQTQTTAQEKRKTRSQMRKDSAQIQQDPGPNHLKKICNPCNKPYKIYDSHIKQSDHKRNIRNTMGFNYFLEDSKDFQKKKKLGLDSQEFKRLEQLATYLQNLADFLEVTLHKSNENEKIELRKIQEQIRKWRQK